MKQATDHWAERRRVFDRLEADVVRLHLARADTPLKLVDGLRYVLSFARLTEVRNPDGTDVDVSRVLHGHAQQVRDELTARLDGAASLWEAVRALPDLVQRTRHARTMLLDTHGVDRDALEAEVTQRMLAVASGGGGGAGYVYFGCYEALERVGLAPDLMVGTSIGALTSLFRCRRARYDPAPQVEAAKRLAWSDVLRAAESESRFGLPATLRLHLQAALSQLFVDQEGTPLRLSTTPIPLHVVATGITVDALKHDLDFYEHYFDEEIRKGVRAGIRGVVKTVGILREFLGRSDSLVQVVLGRDPGTEEFNAVDAAGFSAAVPAVLHYDVLRQDDRMRRLLEGLYADRGITRLGEGGLVSNVPARIAWDSVITGTVGRRNGFVLALDCFAPNPRSLAWFPIQQMVRSANVDRDRKFADLYLPLTRTLSPMNLVPPLRDALRAMRWGREAIEPHLPFVVEMMRPIAVLADREEAA